MPNRARLAILCGLILAAPAPGLRADPPDAKAIAAELKRLDGTVIGDKQNGHHVWLWSVKDWQTKISPRWPPGAQALDEEPRW